ncbi:MAG: YbaY family lipoprotein [Bacteroidota bacterium]
MSKPLTFILSLFLMTVFACNNGDTTLRNTRNDAITGMISYRDSDKIPPTSVITLRLLELEGSENKIINEMTMESGGGGIPYPFSFPYDKSKIEDGKTYALDIDIDFITANLYYTLEPIEVLSNGLKRDVSVILVKGPKSQN